MLSKKNLGIKWEKSAAEISTKIVLTLNHLCIYQYLMEGNQVFSVGFIF